MDILMKDLNGNILKSHFIQDFDLNISDYHFTTKEAMQNEIDSGEFIEHAVFNNNMYGTRLVGNWVPFYTFLLHMFQVVLH